MSFQCHDTLKGAAIDKIIDFVGLSVWMDDNMSQKLESVRALVVHPYLDKSVDIGGNMRQAAQQIRCHLHDESVCNRGWGLLSIDRPLRHGLDHCCR